MELAPFFLPGDKTQGLSQLEMDIWVFGLTLERFGEILCRPGRIAFFQVEASQLVVDGIPEGMAEVGFLQLDNGFIRLPVSFQGQGKVQTGSHILGTLTHRFPEKGQGTGIISAILV